MISREAYIETQTRLLHLADELAAMPIEEFLEAAALIEGLGIGGRHGAFVKRVAEGALAFKRSYPDVPTNVLADLEQKRREVIAEAEARFAGPAAAPAPTVMADRRGQPAYRS